MAQMNLSTKQKQTHRHRHRLMVTEKGRERDAARVWAKQMQTVIHRMDKQTPTVAQGTTFNILCQTIMENSRKKNTHTHICIYNRVTLLYGINIVNQLYFSKILKNRKKENFGD